MADSKRGIKPASCAHSGDFCYSHIPPHHQQSPGEGAAPLESQQPRDPLWTRTALVVGDSSW